MKFEKVVGRQAGGKWVLFKLHNGTAAYVAQNGAVGFFPSWAQALKFTMIDARGPGCVPADELRNAIEALKQVKEDNEWYRYVSAKREQYGEDVCRQTDEIEAEHEELCRRMDTHEDGSLVWFYDD